MNPTLLERIRAVWPLGDSMDHAELVRLLFPAGHPSWLRNGRLDQRSVNAFERALEQGGFRIQGSWIMKGAPKQPPAKRSKEQLLAVLADCARDMASPLHHKRWHAENNRREASVELMALEEEERRNMSPAEKRALAEAERVAAEAAAEATAEAEAEQMLQRMGQGARRPPVDSASRRTIAHKGTTVRRDGQVVRDGRYRGG